ncbi:hypothetical protein J14TS2_45100 [Bacillus sp. J14TS2]|uniref:distal tail protein Dit n=1 Tax=Bacillus sp. J14TS2 TaxID=2807188 RepID=UPI001B0C0EDE|nr:distal tail protein Dit [Bacillus sp. J14TS2]GIN74035.1 hypothetical protein J14TS2_45100 [Bacillus sp. J14TS2]
MIFNGIEKEYITVLRGRKRPFFERDGERRIEVPILIKHDGFSHYQKLKEEIAEWLIHEDAKELIFNDDDDDRRYFAMTDDIEEGDEYLDMSFATIVFICHSKYSDERTFTLNKSLTKSIDGHKSTPWKTKTTFSANQTGYEIKFNSPGKTDLRDINKVKLNYDFVAGDILEIGYSKRRVTLNGKDITNTVVILQSNFIELPIGQVEFTTNHKTEFYYHERYF